MGKIPLSPPNPSDESLNLLFKRTHLNLTVKTISKHTEPQWVQRVAFANTFMSAVETEILNLSKTKPLEWKRYIDDIFLIVEN